MRRIAIAVLVLLWAGSALAASTDARPVPIKNTAFRVTFPIFDDDGDLVTGAASDTPDSEVSCDGGTFTDVTDEITEVATASGMYYLELTSGEMNCDTVAIIVKTATAATKTSPLVMYPEEAGDINVDVTSWNGTAVATPATAGYVYATIKDGTGTGEIDTLSGSVVNVDLVDLATTTTTTTTATTCTTATACTDVTNDVGITQAGADKAWSTAARTLTAATNITDDGGVVNVTAGAIDAVTTATTCTTASTCTALGAGAVDATAVADNAIDAGAIATDAIGAAEVAASALAKGTEITGFNDPSQADITGGAYALDTDASGRIRIVDGTGTGEIDTASGAVLTRDTLMLDKNSAFTNFPIWLFDSDGAALTGLSDIVCRVSLDGAASAITTDTTETEVDSGNMPGLYVVDLTAGETNGNVLAFSCTATGAAPYRTITTPQR